MPCYGVFGKILCLSAYKTLPAVLTCFFTRWYWGGIATAMAQPLKVEQNGQRVQPEQIALS
jgi:hypothetical protein